MPTQNHTEVDAAGMATREPGNRFLYSGSEERVKRKGEDGRDGDRRGRYVPVKTCGTLEYLPSRPENSRRKSPEPPHSKGTSPERTTDPQEAAPREAVDTESVGRQTGGPFGYGLPWYVKNLST